MSEGATDPRIQAALARAEELENPDPEQHVAVYEDVHNTLQQVLSDAGDPSSAAAADEQQPQSQTIGQPESVQAPPGAADAGT